MGILDVLYNLVRSPTQEELAARAHLHRTYVSMVERAARNISIDALSGVAHALELDTWQLVQHAERMRRRR